MIRVTIDDYYNDELLDMNEYVNNPKVKQQIVNFIKDESITELRVSSYGSLIYLKKE